MAVGPRTPCVSRPATGVDTVTESVDRTIASMDESIQLPRKNGELVFETPWEARAFGLAVALNENGNYAWGDFGSRLSSEISRAEQSGEVSTYYERWLRALEKLVVDNGMVTAEEIVSKTRAVEEEDGHHGHDHHHH